jgi:hypothetical protein
MLGLGNYVFFLIQTPLFYQLPISCAYACLMAAFVGITVAMLASTELRRCIGFALAGLAWALAIGARPDYVFSLPALGIPVAAACRLAGRRDGFRARECWRIIVAAALPVACIGVALAAYNWARFGSILETGIKYQLASSDESHVTLARLANLPTGLRAYLLVPPNYFFYFPFLSQSGQTFGAIPWAPFALAALGFPLTLLNPALRRNRVWTVVGTTVLLAFLLNFLVICMYWFLQDRYALDFLPTGVLLALPVTAAALQARRRLTRAVGVVLVAAGALTLFNSVMLGLNDHASDLRPLARVFDYPSYALERLTGFKPGPVQLTVVFPKIKAGVQEPLVAMSGGADLLYLIPADGGRARIGFFHRGAGGPIGEAFSVDDDRRHVLDVDLGALYPPAEHPLFSGWSDSLIDALHRRVNVRLDGRTVLNGSSEFYPNDPLHTSIGFNPIPDYITERRFSGSIIRVRHLGLPSPDEIQTAGGGGPVRLTVKFPVFTAIYGEPLVCTGRSGVGDLLYVTYRGPGVVSFGHDCWGYGPMETGPVSYNPAAEQIIEVDMGSLSRDQAGLLEGKKRLQIRFNGKLLISAYRPFHPTSPIDVAFGFNAIGASTAAASFTGPEFRVDPIPAFPSPPPVVAGGGGVRLSLKFPANKPGIHEPLVVTGRTGAGDAVYVVYEDASHVRFGYDHWGTGGPLSAPLAVDYNTAHTIVISMGYPASAGNSKNSGLQVSCDGVGALDAPGRPFPARPSEIAIGTNSIGSSACDSQFSGEIYLAEQSPSF